MKPVTLHSLKDAQDYEGFLLETAHQSRLQIQELSKSPNALDFLEQLKFERIGCDPLDQSASWNLIEQINQTFTYLASFRAASLLFKWYPSMESLTLNLGVIKGTDIESPYSGGIAAEVFAATSPSSNQKLKKDVTKVQSVSASHKYVFFMCPNIKAGHYRERAATGVKVWSLGL